MKKMVRGDLPYSESVLGRIFIIYTLFTFKILLIFHQLKKYENSIFDLSWLILSEQFGSVIKIHGHSSEKNLV